MNNTVELIGYYGGDKNITLNKSASDSSSTADGAGITIQDAVDASTDASLTWNAAGDKFVFSHKLDVTGILTATGTSVFTNLDISGDADIDGTLETDALTIGGTAIAEFVQDTIGAMFSGNTETRISATYVDGDGTIDLVVDDMTANDVRTVTAGGNTLASNETLAFTAGSNISISESAVSGGDLGWLNENEISPFNAFDTFDRGFYHF
mgnify:CR=1 FL=1